MTDKELTKTLSPARKRRRRKIEHESERFAPCALPLSNSLKSTGKSAHCRYGNELNQTDCIAHQPDNGYHPRAYVWDHTHKRRSGLSVQKGGSISGPLFYT